MELIVVLIVVAVIIIIPIAIYNSLVTLRNHVEEAWSDITIQLKRRYDLIPNLVNTVKGYADHEKEVFTKVTEARANALNAQEKGSVKQTAEAENQFEGALKSLFAVSENYPQLQASQNFQQLQTELVDTENKIQAARRFYNGGVMQLNTKIQSFPASVIAGMFKFQPREFFEVEDQAAVEKPVDVKF